MNIAIGICTKDNPVLLLNALQSIIAQRVAPQQKIVVYIIDTSRSRNTQKLIHQTKKTIPGHILLKSHHLPALAGGVIHARKKLFSLIKEPYVFSLDDDITVNSEWVMSGVAIFTRFPEVGVIGGKTLMKNTAPAAFKRLLIQLGFSKNFWPYALIDLGNKGKFVTEPHHYPSFANLALRTSCIKKIRVDERFGTKRAPLPMFGGEDPDIIEQLIQISSLYYEPHMVAHHFIKSHKFSVSYFCWRYYEWGKERALLEVKYGLPQSTSKRRALLSGVDFLRSLLKARSLLSPLLSCIFSVSYLRAKFIINHFMPSK